MEDNKYEVVKDPEVFATDMGSAFDTEHSNGEEDGGLDNE